MCSRYIQGYFSSALWLLAVPPVPSSGIYGGSLRNTKYLLDTSSSGKLEVWGTGCATWPWDPKITYLLNCETKNCIIVVIFQVHLGKWLLINEAITISFSVLDCPAIKSCYDSEHRKSSRNHSWHPRTLLRSWQNELTQCPVLRWEQKCCSKGISQYVSWNLCLPISSYQHIFNKAHKSCPTALGSCKGKMDPLVLMNQCKSPIPLQKACRETKAMHVLASKDRSYCHHLSSIFIFQEFSTSTDAFLTHLAKIPGV